MESHAGTQKRRRPPAASEPLDLQLLGGVALRRGGAVLALPASRKVRALLAYLALAPRPVGRSALCELLWEVPNDPRSELRWALSKLRGVLDEPDRPRVLTDNDAVALDLSDCSVDAVDIEAAMQRHLETLTVDELRTLAGRFAGEFLAGVEIDRQPLFENWLIAQRRRFRGCQAAVLEHLVRRTDPASDDVFDALDTWLQLAPLDPRAHEALLAALARHRRLREGDEHLAATARLFESEGLDATPIRQAWRSIRAQPLPETVKVSAAPALPSSLSLGSDGATPARRASIAVMPFGVPFGDPFGGPERAGGAGGGLAEALVSDVITRLAKLRVLFVIGHGSVFALARRNIGPEEAGRMLNVDYVASGWVRQRDDRLILTGELLETRSARIIWTDDFDYPVRDTLQALDAIGNSIVAAIVHEDGTRRAQPRDSQTAGFAGCLGGLSPRPVAHVSLQPRGQRFGRRLLPQSDRTGSDVRARVCEPVLHAFPERVSAPDGRSIAGDCAGTRRAGQA